MKPVWKWTLAATAVVLLAAAGGTAYYFLHHKGSLNGKAPGAPLPTLEEKLQALDAPGVFAFRTDVVGVAKAEKDAPDLAKALLGTDEQAVLRAMEAAHVGVIAFPASLEDDKKLPAGSVAERLAADGSLNGLTLRFLDEKRALAAPVNPARRLDATAARALFAYIRQELKAAPAAEDKPAPELALSTFGVALEEAAPAPLPAAFADATREPIFVRLRFFSEKGAIPSLDRITGTGTSLKAATDAALADARRRFKASEPFPTLEAAAAQHLGVAVATETAPIVGSLPFMLRQFIMGQDGLVLHVPGAPELVVFPEDAQIWRVNNLEKLAQAALRTARRPIEEWKKPGVYADRFGVSAYQEAVPGGTVYPLVRGRAFIPAAAMDKAATRASFDEAAAWLLGMFDSDRKMFKYNYFAMRDNYDTRNYNIIRHGLATLTMLQAYELSHDARYLDAARQAVEWVMSLTTWEGSRAYFSHEKLDPKVKLGGLGVILQCMTEYYRLAKIPAWEKTMKGYAETLLAMQEENGHYRSIYQRSGDKPDDGEVTIYPGEANLALVRMYKLFGDKRYLAAVERAFTYYSKWFNDTKKPNTKGNLGAFVPWDMSAMLELYQIDKRDDVAAYVYSMADWLLDNWFVYGYGETYWPELVGGVHPGNGKGDTPVWSTGVFGEGIASAFHVAKLHHDAARMAKYRLATQRMVRFVRQLQFHAGSVAVLPDAEHARGAMPSDFVAEDCRIDFVYHCMTTHYRALRAFDDADWETARTAPDARPAD